MNIRTQERRGHPISEDRLSIEVTTHCNRACRHCFVHATPLEKTSLPLEQAKAMIAEGYHVGYRRLHITGGEPLLWKNLFRVLDFAFELGYQNVLLNTNGSLLTKDTNRRLSKYNGLSISVSLEGTQALHTLFRQTDDYDHIHNAVEGALGAGLNLFIFTTVGRTLLKDLPSFALGVYDRFPAIMHLSLIQLIRPTREVFDLSDELLSPTDFIKLVQIVSLLNLYGHKAEIINNPLAAVVSKRLRLPLVPRVPTLQREGHLIILANGHIALSHSTPDSLGKYKPGAISKILKSDTYQVAVAPDGTICPACLYADLCQESGMNRPSEWFRDMQPGSPYCQRVMSVLDNRLNP